MSKLHQLIDEYLDLCDEAGVPPVLDDEGDPNPYCDHARQLRQAAKQEVVKAEPRGVQGLDRAEIVGAVAEVVGNAVGNAIGRHIAPLREELSGLRAEMHAGRQTQEGIRRQMRANRPRGAPLTDDEWDEHERNYQERGR